MFRTPRNARRCNHLQYKVRHSTHGPFSTCAAYISCAPDHVERLKTPLMKPFLRHTILFAVAVAATVCAPAQTVEPAQLLASAEAMPAVSSSDSAVPDAPSAMMLRASVQPMGAPASKGETAPKYDKTIAAGETAQRLNAGDKVVIAFRELYSPLGLAGSALSAGYSHAVNGAPNYGTNGTAFGKRFGAAVARGSSQEIFSDGVFAPMLRMDPRYYVLGSDYNFGHRALYAVTRVVASKTDSGRTTINAPLLLGNAGATALSTVYYPQINRNAKDSASEYGGSLGGAALGFVVDEFADDVLRAVHLKSKK
jgi:hypothetical protein